MITTKRELARVIEMAKERACSLRDSEVRWKGTEPAGWQTAYMVLGEDRCDEIWDDFDELQDDANEEYMLFMDAPHLAEGGADTNGPDNQGSLERRAGMGVPDNPDRGYHCEPDHASGRGRP